LFPKSKTFWKQEKVVCKNWECAWAFIFFYGVKKDKEYGVKKDKDNHQVITKK
jgi:hypothetical protein